MNNNNNCQVGQQPQDRNDRSVVTTAMTNNKTNQPQSSSHAGSTPNGSSGGQQHNTIGHYMLGKALGEGTFGKVKLGTHILTGEKVAVKVLEKSRIKDKKDVERISREIKILKQLHHPNVVQIYEIIETEKDLYLVMEFVQGGELFDVIVQNQRLKEKMACKYFQELISGINYIHQLGICHRDLKPENLLIDYDQSLKIVDFGLSNLYEQGSTLKTACGSPCYAAPEMIAGNRYNGLMSDLWSCGVVLYAMLCGYLPYEDQKTSDLYKKILNAEYNLPDFLSKDARDMIANIFITDPKHRISIENVRKHPWYQLHKPETPGFNVYPPVIQAQRPDTIVKNNKTYQIIQRPNLLNQKIIQNLETSQGFNRESLLKSIKNNKHNHLTATYYLLLKKHMIRQLKPYCDAFLEFRLKEDSVMNTASEINLKNQRSQNQQPPVQLKSKHVLEQLKNKRDEKQSETPVPGQNPNGQGVIQAHGLGQKFQSIDPNNVIENNKRHSKQQSSHYVKHQNFMEVKNDYTDTVTPASQVSQHASHHSYTTQPNGQQQIQQRGQHNREQQNSRQSNNSKYSQREQHNRAKSGEYKREDPNQKSNRHDERRQQYTAQYNNQNNADFNQQTQQSFAKKQGQNHKNGVSNAFHHRREQSANPYINAGSGNAQQKQSNQGPSSLVAQHQNFNQYQNQIEQMNKEMQFNKQMNESLQKSSRSPRWRSNNNDQNDLSNRSGIRNEYINSKGYQNYHQKQPRQKSQKSQDSIKNSITDDSHPNANQQNQNQFAENLINPYQVKKRAESYNNKRRGDLDNSGSLDKLDNFGIIIEESKNGRRRDTEDDQIEYIKSKNIKETQKGNHREIRAPSSGSSGSQPRVQVAGGYQKDSSGGNISMNSSGVQRRYDSIENQRQSLIEKFTQSPSDQIPSTMSNKNKVGFNNNGQKKIKILNNNQQQIQRSSLQAQNIRNYNTNAVKTYNNPQAQQQTDNESIKIVNILKNKNENNQQQINQIKKQRNSSKSQSITNENTGSIQNNSQYYKHLHLQQQLDMMDQKRQGNQSTEEQQKMLQQYSSNLKKMQQEHQNQMMMQNMQQSYIDMEDGQNSPRENNVEIIKRSQINSNAQQSQQNSVKQVHRKAKSMLNQNGLNVNEVYQNQKVQQVKQSADGSIRNLIQQLVQNKNQPSNSSLQNNNKVNIKKNSTSGHHNNNIHLVQGNGNTAPTMPSAPKSGNVLKLKQQVTKPKSNHRDRERGNSQTLQGANQQNQNLIQQHGTFNNTTQKKKQLVHTTKNNTGGTNHQHNFDMIEGNPITTNHLFSVQHNTSSKDGTRSHLTEQAEPQQQTTQASIVNKSGVTLISNYSKGTTQGKQSIYTQQSQNTEGYLQILQREHDKNQAKSQQQSIVNQSSGSNSIKRNSNVKVQKVQKQKVHQIENIQKQISQNQKAMQNMTQNLFNKNNTGGLVQQPQRQQVDIYDDQKSSNLNESLRGSSRGVGSGRINMNGTNNSSQPQNQRRYSYNNPSGSQGGAMRQKNNSGYAQDKRDSRGNNVHPHNVLNHYQTQDNRKGESDSSNNGSNLQNHQMRLKQHPASTTAAMGGIQQKYNQNGSNGFIQHDTTNSGISNMEDIQQIYDHNNRKPRVNSKNSKGGVQGAPRGHGQNQMVKQNYATQAGGNPASQQVSLMRKYNQQQEQIRQMAGNGGNQGGHVRNYSAPREGAYGQPIGIDDDEIKRQHLLNQSVDMSCLGDFQAQISGMNKQNINFDDIHKLNLSQFGHSVGSIGNNNVKQRHEQRQDQRGSNEGQTKQYKNSNNQKGNKQIKQHNFTNSSSQSQPYDSMNNNHRSQPEHQNFTPNQGTNQQRYQSNFDFSSTQYNVGSSSAGMTGTQGIVGISGIARDGHHLGQDYSQQHVNVLDVQMDRSSRGTAATAANTISGNINRSGGNIGNRPNNNNSVVVPTGSSGDNINGSQTKYSHNHFQASQVYQNQQIERPNDMSSGEIIRRANDNGAYEN